MPAHFCLSFTLLGGTFHGRRDDGEPEWPPSPLRAFQALVAAAAARWKGPQFAAYAAPALEWLERLGPPDILAPASWGTGLRPYRLYVPNNAGDLVTRAWAAGNRDASIAAHRTEKDVRPTHVVGDPPSGGPAVRFVWRLPVAGPAADEFVAVLAAAARGVTHLGWGIDMAAGHAGLIGEPELRTVLGDERLERWSPGAGATPLRVPEPAGGTGLGTLRALIRRHEAFTGRMAGGVPHDVPPLTAYSVAEYRRPTDVAPRPVLAFELRTPDDRGFAPFNTALKTRDVAGMMRNAVERATAAAGWRAEDRAARVHGHAPDGPEQARGEVADVRFAYLPIPSVEYRRNKGTYVGDIRRVMISAHPSLGSELRDIEGRLSGCELLEPDASEAKAVLKSIHFRDDCLKDYCRSSHVWSTVTPVVLPGHEDPGSVRRQLSMAVDPTRRNALRDRLDRRTYNLIRKAFAHAGFPGELLSGADIEWREVGFRRGVAHSRGFELPGEWQRLTRYHVRVRWPTPVRGPVVVGAGRYRGFGLFASENIPVVE